ncbi:GNAT family N-acetyltransferase [Salinibius halmophilus]|uniref:GNAT family N-acetyltransferase n=1 Tax=Salinibius halmophilus TaxID=1853216 RepID=UPI000E674312|nr:GNAT family N-acetyltransferase [Salinibius halmophilus]
MDHLRITSVLEEMDFERIYGFLSQSYWAKGVPEQTLHTAMQHSWCFAVLNEANETLAFARLVTDHATFAYLADVFVDPASRGQGISKYLVAHILAQPEVEGMRRIMLATADAHSLYAKYGFVPINQPEKLMQIHRPDIYLTIA